MTAPTSTRPGASHPAHPHLAAPTHRSPLAVTLHAMREQRRPLLAWGAAGVLLVVAYAAVWPSFRSSSEQYAAVINAMPAAYRALFTVGASDLSTPAGYLGVEFLSMVGPIVLIGYGIAAGAGVLAADEERGTLELLAARPVTRVRMYAERALAMLVCVALLGAAVWLAQVVAGSMASMGIAAGRVLAAVGGLTMLGWIFGAVAFAVGAATGRPGAARAVAAGLAVLAYLANGLADLASGLRGLRPWSPFHWVLGGDPLVNGLGADHVAYLLLVAAVALVVGALPFVRRDLRF